MLEVKYSARFKKEYKLALKRGGTREEMEKVIRLLASGEPLPPEYHDHPLHGKWNNHRDCAASLRLLNEFCSRKTSHSLWKIGF